MAHLGVLPLLASGELPNFPLKQNGALFIIDKTAHSSMQIHRGLLGQFGEVVLANCHGVTEAERLCKTANDNQQTPIIIADSIGSMAGVLPVAALADLVGQYQGYCYIDDTHGASVHGENGCGYVLQALHYQFPERLILISTLAKGFGTLGGLAIFCQPEDAICTKQFAPSYVFGAGPAQAVIDAAIASAEIHLSSEINTLQKKLWDNIKLFDTHMPNQLNAGSSAAFRGIPIGDEQAAIAAGKALQDQGIAVITALYPIVAKGQAMLRLAFSAGHSSEEVKKLVLILASLVKHAEYLD